MKKYETVAQRLNTFDQCSRREKNAGWLIAPWRRSRSSGGGFGFADRKAKKPKATAETIYRVGLSKLFTDLAVMQLVEHGVLDLDAPITKYLPDFKPGNPYEIPSPCGR